MVLALVSFAAHQPHPTVYPSIENAIIALFEAVASVASDMVLTPAPILAGIGITLVYHLLTEGTCHHKKKMMSHSR